MHQYILHFGTQTLSYTGESWFSWDCFLRDPFGEQADFEWNAYQGGAWEGEIVLGQRIMNNSMADLNVRNYLGWYFSRDSLNPWNLLLKDKFEVSLDE